VLPASGSSIELVPGMFEGMHRFFLPPEKCQGTVLTLEDAEAHHALHVLRVRKGEAVDVLDGVGHICHAEVTNLGKRTAELSVRDKEFRSPLPFAVTLIQAIPKGKTFENIVQKATELGVHRIIPLLTERVVVHLEDGSAGTKMDKWRQVAIEAIKQCGSPWLPKLEAPIELNKLLERDETFDLSLVGDLTAATAHPRKHFQDFGRRHEGRMPKTVAAWVGPEGDFTPAELEALRAHGASPITLGPLVLRSDTAAVYTISVINYELGSPA
jgi:16S rRNA (uracil1498-N3)-methyltransferase